MIAFETWLPQIVGYCQLISGDRDLRLAWVNHDTSTTSVTGFDELYEQIFDDLDSDFFQLKLSTLLPNNAKACEALADFLEALKQVDRDRTTCTELRDPLTLLASAQWQAMRSLALVVIGTVNN